MGLDPEAMIQKMRQGIEEEKRKGQTPVEILFYHCDHLGTPLALTDRQGQVAWAAKYDPWGNVEEEFNPRNLEQDIRLPGQHLDRETGLYYNYHRYYDPRIGGYINQDPIGLIGGMNSYAYPNNPFQKMDPLGLYESIDQVLAVGIPRAYTAKQDADTALALAQQNFNSNELHNGRGDAYRHCVWSCLMTQHIGETMAETVGNIHEIHGNKNGQPPEEERMDQTNNAVGRQCGLHQDKKSCSDRCMDALKGGGLVGLDGGPLFLGK